MSKNNHRVALALLDKDRKAQVAGTPTINKDLLIWWLAQNYPATFIRGVQAQEQASQPRRIRLDANIGGTTLEGIRALRSAFSGVGLAEAKGYVDQLQGGKGPVFFSVPAGRVSEVTSALKDHFFFEYVSD